MAKVKYYAKENSSIGTHSFYAVPRLTFELSRQTGLRRTPSSARLSTNGAQEAKGQYIPPAFLRPFGSKR